MNRARFNHPLTQAQYSDDNGEIRVERNGLVGWFSRDGQWIRGVLREADPLMCLWIGGHDFSKSLPMQNTRLHVDTRVGVQSNTAQADKT